MSRADALAVGLRMLGAFFIVTGLAEVGYAVTGWLSAREMDNAWLQGDAAKREAYSHATHAIITTAGGFMLLLASRYIRRGGDDEKKEPN